MRPLALLLLAPLALVACDGGDDCGGTCLDSFLVSLGGVEADAGFYVVTATVDEEQVVFERKRTKRTETTRRRRTARGLPPDRQPGEGQRGDTDDDRDERFDIGGEEMR